MKWCSKWTRFIQKRFNPLSYSIMILFFFGAHYSLYADVVVATGISSVHLLPLILVLFFFFFSLRLFDEVKDLKTDTQYYPERPLPKGDMTVREVLRMAAAMLVLDLVFLSLYGPWSLLCGALVVLYTLLMYKEFFVSRWLRARLTTYAVTHTFVVVLMSITVFVSLFNASPSSIPAYLFYFSLANWFVFSLFEFGRKTFVSEEERSGIDSYSKIFSRHGAVLLILFTSAAGAFFITQVASQMGSKVLTASILVLALSGFLYAIQNTLMFAKIFRLLTNSFIVIAFGVTIVT